MEPFLSFRLFRLSGTEVTVASALLFTAILFVTWLAARLARKLIAERILGKTNLPAGTRYAVGRVLAYLIFAVGGMLALNSLGINATGLAAFGAALGVGLGFGLQDIVKNFVAGIIVLLERPISIGDRIAIDKVTGDVAEIRTRSTVIRTNDDVFLIVPNSKFITDTVTNWSYRSDRIRFRIPVGVAYSSNPREVEAALLEAARRVPSALATPGPAVYFKGFGDSTLDFELLCWTEQGLHKRPSFVSDVNYAIWEELGRRSIEIPSPQRDIRIRGIEGLEGLDFLAPKDGSEEAPSSAGTLRPGTKPAILKDVRKEKETHS